MMVKSQKVKIVRQAVSHITAFYASVLVSHGQMLFSVFLCGGRKRIWSGLQSLLILAPPTAVGGVNDRNIICYCSTVTRAISIVLYKHVSLKFIGCENRSEVGCFNKQLFKVENSV